MTILEDPALVDPISEEVVDDGSLRLGEAQGPRISAASGEEVAADQTEDESPSSGGISPSLAAVAAALATAAAGWMIGGIFVGSFARIVGVLAGLLGGAVMAASYRTKRPVVVQMLALPVAVVFGGLLVAPDATGGTANLPSLVVEALKSGGLAAPPIPFDPGWRFLLVVLMVCLAVTASAAGLAFGRPRLSVFIPAPVTVGAILLQPQGAEVVSVSMALVLTVGALAVAFGADLASQGTTGTGFEVRRFVRAGVIVAGISAVLIALAQLGVLLPSEPESSVIPPKRPEQPPPARDRVIFDYSLSGFPDNEKPTLRLGVLDVYDKNAWMIPPFDPKRIVPVKPHQLLPGAPTLAGAPVAVKVHLDDLEGRSAPDLANPARVDGGPAGLDVDPRTQVLRFPGRARAGTTYTVVAAPPASAAQLLTVKAVPRSMAEFLSAPPAPEAVQNLLAQIPPNTPLYERLQFVRTKFFESVVAAGPGVPKDLPPQRVADMLAGKEASPYEISAGEALLARWAGIPARIGYGYYGGDKRADGSFEVRPRHGALWLEVYFEGSGWQPSSVPSSTCRCG